MNPLKILIAFVFFVVLAVACRKENCQTDKQIKTDELSNTTWLGAYGQKATPTIYDTTFIFSLKGDGFINIYIDKSFYHKNADSIIKIYKDLKNRVPDGKGFYRYDGTTFDATIELYRVGKPYILTGNISPNKAAIIGDIKFSDVAEGAFMMNPDYIIVK